MLLYDNTIKERSDDWLINIPFTIVFHNGRIFVHYARFNRNGHEAIRILMFEHDVINKSTFSFLIWV
jgi:hypothetical protein